MISSLTGNVSQKCHGKLFGNEAQVTRNLHDYCCTYPNSGSNELLFGVQLNGAVTETMKFFKQLGLLLWKNYRLQIRRPVASFFQLGLPILFILILLLVRVLRIQQEYIGAEVWESFTPSNLPFRHPGGGTWQLAFTPNNTRSHELMSKVSSNLKLKPGKPFPSETEMVAALVGDQENKGAGGWNYLAGIVFIDGEVHGLTYKIRMPSSLRNSKDNSTKKISAFQTGSGTWQTKSVFPLTFDGLGPRTNKSISGGPPDYYKEGFLAIQSAIDHAFTVQKLKEQNITRTLSSMQIDMQRFPYPDYLRDPFIAAIQNSLPLLLMLSLVYNQLVTVKEIVYEKENKLKVTPFTLDCLVYVWILHLIMIVIMIL